MALQTMLLDPTATSYTDNQIVEKINSATNQISRVDALDADALDLVQTGPSSGDNKVKKVNRKSTGELEVVYDDVPV